MPNWVSNIVKCDNSDALHQLRDFSLIIPEPPSIALFTGWASQRAAQLFQQGKSWREVGRNPFGAGTVFQYYWCEAMAG